MHQHRQQMGHILAISGQLTSTFPTSCTQTPKSNYCASVRKRELDSVCDGGGEVPAWHLPRTIAKRLSKHAHRQGR